MIRFLNVTLEHQPDKGVKNASFSVNRGEFVLLSGPTGAGKTTVLRLIYSELTPSSGKVLVDNQFQHNSDKRYIARLRHKIGIVFPEPRLLRDRDVFENVSLPLRIAGKSQKHITFRVNQLLYRFGLQDRAHAFPEELSSGEQKKAAIARALVARPLLLLADEPLSNIDADCAADILEQLADINAEGMTVLVATHIYEPYENIASRTIRLKDGRIIK